MKFPVSFALSLFISISAIGADIQVAFNSLKNSAIDYEPTGQVCEQVARLQFSEDYNPSLYDITIGVEYSVDGRTIGELDLVITNKATHQVVVVGEVKCWKSLGGALDKAHDQRKRFIRTLYREGSNVDFDSKGQGLFEADQFGNVEFVSIAQMGSTDQGFDVDLSYTLRELMSLRGLLLDCQAQGLCPKP